MRSGSWERGLGGSAMAALMALAMLSCESLVGIESLSLAPQDAALDENATESGQGSGPDVEADADEVGCPDPPPKAGPCVGTGECVYDCAAHAEFTVATCLSGSWQTTALPCGTVHCGDSNCDTPATVCLKTSKQQESCVPNPCGTGAMTVDCACAATLCTGSFPSCDGQGTRGFVVACSAR